VAASAGGELDKAFGHLFDAVEIRDPQLITLKCLPDTLHLRKDPRFDEILARMGLK